MPASELRSCTPTLNLGLKRPWKTSGEALKKGLQTAFLVLHTSSRPPPFSLGDKSAAAASQVHGEDYLVPATAPHETDVTMATGPPGNGTNYSEQGRVSRWAALI